MNYDFQSTDDFDREFKNLYKKHASLKSDLLQLQKDIIEGKNIGADLGGGFYKIRMNIASKKTGKNSGARVISYETIISTQNKLILFCSIYTKTDFDKIDISILRKNLGI
jgi:hypothetical protein